MSHMSELDSEARGYDAQPKPLCADCAAAQDRWIHLDPRTARGIATATGKPAYYTVREQVRLIREWCHRANH